jgi:hypothetical protein
VLVVLMMMMMLTLLLVVVLDLSQTYSSASNTHACSEWGLGTGKRSTGKRNVQRSDGVLFGRLRLKSNHEINHCVSPHPFPFPAF